MDEADDTKPSGLVARLRAGWENLALRFVVLFMVYLGIASLGYPLWREQNREALDFMMSATATLEYYLFLPFTSEVAVRNTMVVLMGFSVKIIEECTGVYEALIFSSAVLAFPTTWAKRGIGIGLGVPMIYGFNLLRIMVLIIVGKFFPESFDFMHLYFWQATLILMITSVWALWIFKVVIRETPEPTGA
jgi:archaeosortase B (VPXXXP-CTERM-specific)